MGKSEKTLPWCGDRLHLFVESETVRYLKQLYTLRVAAYTWLDTYTVHRMFEGLKGIQDGFRSPKTA